MIILSKNDAREIFGMEEQKATDIVVKVANPKEIPTIIQKIKHLLPDTRIISNEDLKVSYQNIFDYKSGIFLALFIVAIFTFFMIIYDKSSSVMSEQKEEIAILKAVGWKIEDVIKLKFYESFIISFVSFLAGVSLAIFYVFWLQAPILADIFSGYSMLKAPLQLHFYFDIASLFLLFFITVIIYISATIIPSWKIATIDTGEIIK